MKIISNDGIKDVIIDENNGDIYDQSGNLIDNDNLQSNLSISEFLDKAWDSENYSTALLNESRENLSLDGFNEAEVSELKNNDSQSPDNENEFTVSDIS